jgi:hypothetical protein
MRKLLYPVELETSGLKLWVCSDGALWPEKSLADDWEDLIDKVRFKLSTKSK